MVIPTAISISCCRGPIESKISEPWPENSAYGEFTLKAAVAPPALGHVGFVLQKHGRKSKSRPKAALQIQILDRSSQAE
jgi:hypothetical protein